MLNPLRSVLPAPRLAAREKPIVLGALGAAVTLVVIITIAQPGGPSSAERLKAYIDDHAQSMIVPEHSSTLTTVRDGYSTSPGIPTLVAGGTNHDWARLVLLYGGWPMTEANVTVMTRWMRQENGPDNWFNRNNPMNSGGPGGTGSYPSLTRAAESVAANLRKNPGYAGIVAGFADGRTTEATEAAIWASPWATGHYGNGARWHYTPVAVVKAPAAAW
jgi:hypothetical protein